MKKQPPPERTSWLEQAYPQMHYLVLALDGDEGASSWLEQNSHGTAVFRRALGGEKQALASLRNGTADHLDDLFEMIDNDDLTEWLSERVPPLHLLFAAVKGDDAVVGRLKASAVKLVPVLREVRQRYLNRTDGTGEFGGGGALAEMGCLIGEMHLEHGEYERAIEAFSRALETQSAPDLYEGRARAYRGLAERDEAAAALLRQRLR